MPFSYFRKDNGWIVWSAGPDGDCDLTPASLSTLGHLTQSTTQTVRALSGSHTYDPTNGAPSNGDIWRMKQ